MEAGLACLVRQPGKWDEFLVCLYQKISSRLPGKLCYYFESKLKIACCGIFEPSSRQPA